MCANRKHVSISTNDKVESLKHLGKGWQCNYQQNFFVEEQISVDRKRNWFMVWNTGVSYQSNK